MHCDLDDLCAVQGEADAPLTQLRLLADGLLQDFVVSLQQSVVFRLELLQLHGAALQALMVLRQLGLQLLNLRDQLLPLRHNMEEVHAGSDQRW